MTNSFGLVAQFLLDNPQMKGTCGSSGVSARAAVSSSFALGKSFARRASRPSLVFKLTFTGCALDDAAVGVGVSLSSGGMQEFTIRQLASNAPLAAHPHQICRLLNVGFIVG